MLDKRSKKILIIFGLVLLGIVLTEVLRPKPIDWRPSYTATDKIPFGGYVLFQEAPNLFPNTEIKVVEKDPFQFLTASTYASNSAYFFNNNELFFDKKQSEKLLHYAEAGNTVFISARNIGYILSDSLGLAVNSDYKLLEEEVHPKLFAANLAQESRSPFKKGVFKTKFEKIDTLNTQALGYFETEGPAREEINFIRVSRGKGSFLIHNLPEAFSNYYLLNGNQHYAAQVLSYLKADTIYWDAYLKTGKKVITSPMRFVLDQAPLAWAYYVLIVGLLVFVLFRGKREQRIVPVIKPLENASVAFTKTIGNLYFQHNDYSNILAKKITYFLENIRSKYYLDTNNINDDLIKKLALKSGNPLEKTQKLMFLIKHLKEKTVHGQADLLELNKQIEAFRL